MLNYQYHVSESEVTKRSGLELDGEGTVSVKQ